MNRTEAEHLLDAYKCTIDLYGEDADSAKALRTVILDAMTTTVYYPYITGLNLTQESMHKFASNMLTIEESK